jgi:hypothetical protein
MTNVKRLRAALIERVLSGEGRLSTELRRAAFDNAGLTGPLGALIEKVAHSAPQTTDEDFAAARASGLTEDQLFEVVVCAAIGQAARQQDQALAALASAAGET